MNDVAYKKLAERLDALPNGFPPTQDGTELRLLAVLYTPEEADLVAKLRLTQETPEQITDRIGGDLETLQPMLQSLGFRGLISFAPSPDGDGMVYGLLPVVIGVFQYQYERIDKEMAELWEEYYTKAFGKALEKQPPYHRVIPVKQSIPMDLEIHPFESATELLASAQAWGAVPCVCRTQKALIGEPCGHPVDVCLLMGPMPGMFDGFPGIQAMTRDEALAALQRSADAGLVHSVSNAQEGLTYMCNCCTCSCVVLRGMAEMGIANVVARSAFVNTVNAERCDGCEDCVAHCQFEALELDGDNMMQVNAVSCVGCGVCVPHCSQGALALVRRPEEEIKPIPVSMGDWMQERAIARGINISDVL